MAKNGENTLTGLTSIEKGIYIYIYIYIYVQ